MREVIKGDMMTSRDQAYIDAFLEYDLVKKGFSIVYATSTSSRLYL